MAGLGGMAARHVAGIAHSRHAHLQQLRVAAAVRLMAVGAVFHDGRMLPQKRTTAFGMTAVAILVDGALDELAWVRTSMRVVATGAGNLALAVRHVRGALQLRPAHLMALEAQSRLRLFGAYGGGKGCAVTRLRSQGRITLGRAAVVDPMTVHASHGARLVRAASPEHLIALRVAGQASGILFLHRGIGTLGEADWNRVLAAASIHVSFTRPVTRFAAPNIGRIPGMRHGIAHDSVNETLLLLLVASRTYFRANIVAIRLGRGWSSLRRSRASRLLFRGARALGPGDAPG